MSIETPPDGFQEELEPGKEPNPMPIRKPRTRLPRMSSDSSRVWSLVETVPTANHSGPFKKWWRPVMAWQYAIICLFDFLVAPVLTMVFFQGAETNYVQWVPLTLQNGGLYHLSMGAVLGIYVWSRGQEKLNHIES